MAKGKFGELDILAILRPAEDKKKTITEICNESGISRSIFYKWQYKYRDEDIARQENINNLRDENTYLRQLFVDLTLKIKTLQEGIED